MPAKVAAGVGRGRLPDRDYQQDGNQHAQCNFTHAALLRGFPRNFICGTGPSECGRSAQLSTSGRASGPRRAAPFHATIPAGGPMRAIALSLVLGIAGPAMATNLGMGPQPSHNAARVSPKDPPRLPLKPPDYDEILREIIGLPS